MGRRFFYVLSLYLKRCKGGVVDSVAEDLELGARLDVLLCQPDCGIGVDVGDRGNFLLRRNRIGRPVDIKVGDGSLAAPCEMELPLASLRAFAVAGEERVP